MGDFLRRALPVLVLLTCALPASAATSDQVEQARALLNSARSSSPEIQEVLRVLE